jgi:hypothetical protein
VSELPAGRLPHSEGDELLERLLHLKSSLAAFEVQVKEFYEVIEAISTSQDHLAKLSLTSRTPPTPDELGERNADEQQAQEWVSDTETAELLFDHFGYVVDEIQNETQELKGNIRSAEEVLGITLDKARNDLIKVNLFVSSGALVCGFGVGGAVSFIFPPSPLSPPTPFPPRFKPPFHIKLRDQALCYSFGFVPRH